MTVSSRPIAHCRHALAIVSPGASNAGLQEDALHVFQSAGGVLASLSSPADLPEALSLALSDGRNRLIVVGGDGTISCVVDALLAGSHDFTVGVVPAGTGNDFARSLDLPIDDIDAAWSIALGGQPRPIDVVQLNGAHPRWFINAITAGFGGRQAAEAASDHKSALGKVAYWLAAATQLGEMPEFDVRISARSQDVSVRCLGFWLANGRSTGGGFPIAPAASLDDGMLDVVVVPSMSALELVAAGIDLTLLGAEQSDRVWTFRTAGLAIEASQELPLSIDGDPWNCSRLECHVLQKAVRIMVDKNVPAAGSGVAASEK